MPAPVERSGPAEVVRELAGLADPVKAAGAARFFKTGPGQYGEGDIFLGVTVPAQRAVARRYRDLDLAGIAALLHSAVHEHRLTALLILVDRYRCAEPAGRDAIFDFYLANTRWINNWDLVDSSAEHIVGRHLDGQPGGPEYRLLVDLAGSPDVWERRIAMLACLHFIKLGHCAEAFAVIGVLEHDPHDLIRKAVGWMLREIGKRCGRQTLVDWLRADARYQRLPRTTLRYAIEHFPPEERRAYLAGYS